jgi:hypothetical protein
MKNLTETGFGIAAAFSFARVRKISHLCFCCLLLFCVSSAVPSFCAEDFQIDSFVVSGGGGSSSDSDYEIIGTIGQAVSGTIGDTSNSIQSGFWNDTIVDGAVLITWAGGDSFNWFINDAAGTPGGDPGWTLTNIVGTLDITATSSSQFAVLLQTLNGSSPGLAANWVNTSGYTWSIATASYGISGFAAEKFNLATNNFANDAGRGGNFSIEQSGNTLVLRFNPLFAVADAGLRPSGSGTKINVLANDLFNGGTPSIAALDSTSGAGGTLSQLGAFVFYTPPAGDPGSDSFHYTLSDGNGHTASGTVVITIRGADNSQSSNIVGYSGVPGSFTIMFVGIPGLSYHIQWASAVNGPWTSFDAKTASTNGSFSETDTVNRGTAFYRTIYP